MAWTTGRNQIIAAPAVIKAALADAATADIGEIEQNVNYTLTPDEVEIQLESGVEYKTVGYTLELTAVIANFTGTNISEIEALANQDVDVDIEQQSVVFANPKTYSISESRLNVSGSGTLGRGKNAGIPITVKTYMTKISDKLTVTDAAN